MAVFLGFLVTSLSLARLAALAAEVRDHAFDEALGNMTRLPVIRSKRLKLLVSRKPSEYFKSWNVDHFGVFLLALE